VRSAAPRTLAPHRRHLPDCLVAQQTGVLLGAHDTHHGHEERDERHVGADCQQQHAQRDGNDGTHDRQEQRAPRSPRLRSEIASEIRVALELLFDLAKDALFVFRERHEIS